MGNNRLVNYAFQEEDTFFCLDCRKECPIETDILLCSECMKNYDTERLWKEHDNNKIDVLDFNESKKFRDKYRLKKGD